MVAFGHTAVGTVVGISVYHFLGPGDIATGLITAGAAGWFSHYVFDTIPHGHFFRSSKNYERNILLVIIFDVITPAVFLLFLAHSLGKNPIEILYLVFGIGGAQLPDVVAGITTLGLLPSYNFIKAEYKFHMGTHWHGKDDQALLFSIKDIWQILFFILAILVLIKY